MSLLSRRSNIVAQSTPSVATRRRVTLTAAQVKALYTTPQVLVPAPGAGKVVSVDEIVCSLKYSTAVFTGSNAVEFRYTDGSGAKVSGDAAYAWLNGSADAPAKVIAAAVTPVANAAVVAAVPSANPGGSTAASTVTFDVLYRVVNL